ncbi:unnamed protein product [Clonostachys byssicola]|uniref:NmrA-like domain-containing protein n=1 Tax=Clonostachys byssicola TaxID=160290 RepID=A0A9N9XXI2_9HYPO|nr:unnamed protein product [Clonostachys byssicola]
MAHTVALLGPNGRVGASALRHLLVAQKAGRINLVLLHRPGGPPKHVPKDAKIDVREVDISGTQGHILEALRGVHVLFSALGYSAAPHEPNVLEAAGKTPGFVTFIPCFISIPLHLEDYDVVPFAKPQLAFQRRAAELGVGFTKVTTGVFAEDFFNGVFGTDPRLNQVTAGQSQLTNPLPISTLDHIGEAIADILCRDPVSITNKVFSAVTLRSTGQEFLATFEKLNGSPPKLINYSQKDIERLLQEASMVGLLMTLYMKHWGKVDLVYENPIPPLTPEPLEGFLKRFIKQD